MKWNVLLAHAPGEEDLAEQLAGPLREAGYEVAHRGTVLVGQSVVEEASKALQTGGPVLLCATIKAMGTSWARRLVNAAHIYSDVRVFPVQMEDEADVESVTFDARVARYWEDPAKAVNELIEALQRYYPVEDERQAAPVAHNAERRYRELALRSYDIIDLANLPEKDRHLATQRMLLSSSRSAGAIEPSRVGLPTASSDTSKK